MVNKLIDEIKPFIVMEVLEKASEMEKMGIDVIHLEVGEPDFDIPEAVEEESTRAIQNGHTHYTHSLGDLQLREAIVRYYQRMYGVEASPENVVVTSGSSPAILLALSSIIEPGDEVILSNPGYACYSNFVRYVHGKAVEVPVFPENGFQYSPRAIAEKITDRTKAIFINSPMNPTGNLLSPEVMKEIAGLGPTIISDEIYQGLVYEGKPHSILEYTDNAFVINGFSKAYAMTGLRLGYTICPREFVRPIQKLQQTLFICAGSVAPRCGIVALENCDDDLEEMKRIYNQRRIYMIDRLKKMGFTIPAEPTGAFYIFVDCRHVSSDSFHLAFDILEKAHVGVTPGVDFGSNGEGFLRFSYASSIENIEEGLNRLEKHLKNR
ncbi:MAG TPA: pyridoxal phosphate-dependent aminotransferase [Prolixibacteraceae bacterium]|nr:pyridoxal phosphate-dependent aminotransferase [Prolixibacteraceae bacterium]